MSGKDWSIHAINILGFRSHKDTQIRGLKRVNWFLGKNATGKSSIIDAIAYGFTGVCRGTDRGGRGADDLVSDFKDTHSPNAFTIGINWGGGGLTRQGPGQGPTSQAQVNITKALGIPPSIVQALTDVTRLLDAPPKEQQALLEQVLGIEVTPDVVAKALGEYSRLQMAPVNSLDDLLVFEKTAREQRTLSRRAVENAPAKIVPATGILPEEATHWTLAEAEARLAGVNSKLEGLIEKRGAARPQTAMKETLLRLEKEVASLSRSLDATADPTDTIKDVVTEMARRQEVLHALRQAEKDSDEAQDNLRLRLLEANHDSCFLCARKFTGKGYQAAKDAAQAAVAKHGQGALGEKEQIDALKALDKRSAQLELVRDQRRSWEAEIKAKAEQILSLKATMTVGGDAPDTATLDAQIAKGNQVKAAIEEVVAALKHNAKVDESATLLVETKKAWEAAVEILSTLRTSLVTDRIKAFEDKANILLSVMGFKVQITTEPFEIYVNGRRPVMLSISQRMRVGLGLQMTLANMAGLRFVCLDAVEAFDAESMAALKEIVRKVKQFQFFLCAKADNPKEMERDEDWAVYSVALKGEVSEVTAL